MKLPRLRRFVYDLGSDAAVGLPAFFEIWFLVIAFFLIYATLKVPVSSQANEVIVYTRNGFSIITWLSLAVFFHLWTAVHVTKGYTTVRTMKNFRKVTVFVAVISFIKAILSVVNLAVYVKYPDKLILLYYLGEAVSWFALTAFFVGYYIKSTKKKTEHHHHHHHHHSSSEGSDPVVPRGDESVYEVH